MAASIVSRSSHRAIRSIPRRSINSIRVVNAPVDYFQRGGQCSPERWSTITSVLTPTTRNPAVQGAVFVLRRVTPMVHRGTRKPPRFVDSTEVELSGMVSQPGGSMKKSKFTETQIAPILKQADAGVPVTR